jgi:hypothetical protein
MNLIKWKTSLFNDKKAFVKTQKIHFSLPKRWKDVDSNKCDVKISSSMIQDKKIC